MSSPPTQDDLAAGRVCIERGNATSAGMNSTTLPTVVHAQAQKAKGAAASCIAGSSDSVIQPTKAGSDGQSAAAPTPRTPSVGRLRSWYSSLLRLTLSHARWSGRSHTSFSHPSTWSTLSCPAAVSSFTLPM
jgi:hypothetical protein